MKNILFPLFFISLCVSFNAQKIPPNHIKSIQLLHTNESTFNHIIPLGKTFELNFDDLDGDQKDYYYKIELMTHDWEKSNLISNQYIIIINIWPYQCNFLRPFQRKQSIIFK